MLAASTQAASSDPVVLVHPHGAIADTILKQAAKDYAAETGVEVLVKSAGWGQLHSELLENITRGEGADIVTVGNTWASDLYERGMLIPLSSYFDSWRQRRGNKGDITRDFVRHLDFTYMFPDKNSAGTQLPVWHILPLDVGTRVFFYRKDLYRKHLVRTSPPLTIEEAVRFAKEIIDKDPSIPNGWAVPGGGGSTEVMQVLLSFVMGNGSSFIGTEEQCTFESKEYLDALRSYTSLYGTQHDFFDGSSSAIAEAFGRGEVVQMVGASWLYGSLLSRLSEDMVGVSAIPAGPVGPYLFQGGSGWAIPSWVPEDRRDRAWSFIEYFMEPYKPYLKELVFGAALIPAYESVNRVSRLTVDDALQMSQLLLYDSGGHEVPLTAPGVVLSNADGDINSNGPQQVAIQSGDWVDFNKSYLSIDLGAPTQLSGYTIRTGSSSYERDPVGWEFAGFNESKQGWDTLHRHDNLGNVPLLRQELVGRQQFSTLMTYRKYRFIPTKLRGSVCATVCRTILDQLAFAVPLHYPQRGFFKMGRLEMNNTIERMVQRIYKGESHAASAAMACRELTTVLWDPEESTSSDHTVVILIIVFSSVFGVFFIAAVLYRFFLVRQVRKHAEINEKLRSDKEMAEDLARAVAVMELDKVQYLFSLKKPNRIQSAFILIVTMLKEYRAYLPAAVLNVDEDFSEDDDGRRDSVSVSVGTTSEMDVRAKEKALEVGVRIRKGTVMRISIQMQQALRFENFDKSTHWLETVLSVISAQSGISLYMTADSMLGAWNAHKVCPKHALWAMQCALMLQNRLVEIPSWWSLSLSSGTLAVGQLGSDSQKAPFITGVPLRQVEVMSTLSMHLQARVLATDSIMELSSFVVNARPVDAIPAEPHSCSPPIITVWEVLGMNMSSEKQDEEQFRNGWAKMRNNNFTEALTVFTEIAKQVPDQQVIRLLKIAKYAAKSPDDLLTDGVYFRRLEGWTDYEEFSKNIPLPSGVQCLEGSSHSPVASSGSGLIVQNVPDSSSLRDEVEKEQNKMKKTDPLKSFPTCPVDKEVLRLSAEGKSEWVCKKCCIVHHGKKWVCVKCKQSYCLTCFPLLGKGGTGKLGKEIIDRQGTTWHRSETILGKGAYGTVWLAMESGSLAAMKTVKMPDSMNEVNALLSEVDLLSELRHENIVAYLSSCVHSNHIIICMEYVSGGSISSLLEQFGPALPPDPVKKYLKDILLGLHFLHTNDIVHRDLKPGNVLLMIDGQCKLSDFGTSTRTTELERGGKKVIGTPIFMSPEACRGESGKVVDIWALGITVFQMIMGEMPYPIRGFAPRKFLVAVSTGELIPDSSAVANPLCKSFIDACLLSDVAVRPTTSKLLVHPFVL